jgi:hypothetical protein
VADLGIGTANDGPTPTTESLSAAFRTTLTPETRARAARMVRQQAGAGAEGSAHGQEYESNDPKRSAGQSCDPACTVAE